MAEYNFNVDKIDCTLQANTDNPNEAIATHLRYLADIIEKMPIEDIQFTCSYGLRHVSGNHLIVGDTLYTGGNATCDQYQFEGGESLRVFNAVVAETSIAFSEDIDTPDGDVLEMWIGSNRENEDNLIKVTHTSE